MSKTKKIILTLVALVFLIPAAGFGYLYFKLNAMYDKEEANQIKQQTTNKEENKKEKGITNILLAGVDGNNLDRGNRSDAMIIMTIDENNKDIRLTSLARDTYVDIPGHGTEKLTHAYAYDGPNLLLQTINENFGLNIDKYVSVSFDSFANIIDNLGGVEIEIIDREVSHIPGINSAGVHNLNGDQALAYSRIRYADSAYQRDNRQRTVIQSIYKKIVDGNTSELINIGMSMLPYVKTNMQPLDILSLGNKVVKINDRDFDQLEFPLDGHRTGHVISKEKGFVIEWEKDYNLEQLNKFINDYKNFEKQE